MSRSDLASCVYGLQFASLFYSSEYPAKDEDYHPVTEKLLNHAQGKKGNIMSIFISKKWEYYIISNLYLSSLH